MPSIVAFGFAPAGIMPTVFRCEAYSSFTPYPRLAGCTSPS